MIYKLVKFLIGYMATKDKVYLADVLLDDVLASKEYSISDFMAERIITTVIKSTGNKITSFIVKD